jgi:hypothetical protein
MSTVGYLGKIQVWGSQKMAEKEEENRKVKSNEDSCSLLTFCQVLTLSNCGRVVDVNVLHNHPRS